MSDEEPWYRMLMGLLKSPAKTKQNAPAPVPAEAPGPSTASQPPQQAQAFRPARPSASHPIDIPKPSGSPKSSRRCRAGSEKKMTRYERRTTYSTIKSTEQCNKPPKSPKGYHQKTLVSRDQRGVKPLVSFGKGSEASFAAGSSAVTGILPIATGAVQKATRAVPKKRGEESTAYNEKNKKQTDILKNQYFRGKEGKNSTDETTAVGKRASSQSAAGKPKMRPYKSVSECSLRRCSQVEGLGSQEMGLNLSLQERRRKLGGYGYKERSPFTSSLSRSASSRSLNLTSSPESANATDRKWHSTRNWQQQRTPIDRKRETTAPLNKTTAVGKRASSQSAAGKPKMRPYKSVSECSLRRCSQVEGLGSLEMGLNLSLQERRRKLGGYGYKERSPFTSSLSRSASSRSLNLTSSPESANAADRSCSCSRERRHRHGAGAVTHRSSYTEQSEQSFHRNPSGTLALRSRKDKFLAMQKKDKDTKKKGPKRQ